MRAARVREHTGRQGTGTHQQPCMCRAAGNCPLPHPDLGTAVLLMGCTQSTLWSSASSSPRGNPNSRFRSTENTQQWQSGAAPGLALMVQGGPAPASTAGHCAGPGQPVLAELRVVGAPAALLSWSISHPVPPRPVQPPCPQHPRVSPAGRSGVPARERGLQGRCSPGVGETKTSIKERSCFSNKKQ